jgi:hypothetical protein
MCNRLSRSTPKHPLPAGGRGSLVAGVASSRGGSRAGSSDVIPDHVISCHIIPCYIKRPQQLWRGRGFHPQPLGAVLYHIILYLFAELLHAAPQHASKTTQPEDTDLASLFA